jgi:hypothetical protein
MTLKAGLALSFEGLISGIGITEENFNQIVPTSMEYAVTDLALGDSDGVVKSFYKVPNTTKLYSVTSNTEVYLTNFDTREVLGNWPLTPWISATRMKGEGTNWKARPLIAGALGNNAAEITDPFMMVSSNESYELPAFKEFIGCLSDSPLRYGDIDNNTTKELVLILDQDLIVFSPQQQKVIFSTKFSNSDELKPEEVESWFEGSNSESSTQYVASSGFGNGLRASFPATRSFSKTFIDDFNNDGKKDIIVWRKLYESNLATDPILGFKLEGELFVHYQLEGGEYQIQVSQPPVEGEFEPDPAQQAQIQGWLTTKNQTWQSGFPSKSECVGQEGQLIPEMHDLLLNDPDVLT